MAGPRQPNMGTPGPWPGLNASAHSTPSPSPLLPHTHTYTHTYTHACARFRSPTMLRHSCTILVFIGTAFLAPYFVHVGTCDATPAGWAWTHCPGAYAASITYVVISMLLLNVQVRDSCCWACDGQAAPRPGPEARAVGGCL
jgi:hypothetical protein